MPSRTITEAPHRVAVIADAHLHDINSDYDFEGLNLSGDQLTLRSWTDTRRSSRVFNESKAALIYTLQDIVNRGIKYVVLLGDYSDDGQIESIDRVKQLLHSYSQQFGLRFFAVNGNHDAVALHGKQQSTRFVLDTERTVLVTSDPKVAAFEPDSAVLTHKMSCEGVASSVGKMSEYGLCNSQDFIHWETPFGLDDCVNSRQYSATSNDGETTHELVDASYLVEPEDGLWLMMIDANVFEPRNGGVNPAKKKAFIDSSEAGWNAVLRQRPHLLRWINDVTVRAKNTSKTLLVFSHYPIIDPFGGTADLAFDLFGNYDMHRRRPDQAVANSLLDAGVNTHFAGHLHIHSVSQFAHNNLTLIDHVVPSLVAYPPGYKIIDASAHKLDTTLVSIGNMELDTRLINHYAQEQTLRGVADKATLVASNYGEFLYHRMRLRAIHHYLPKDWPDDITRAVADTSLADLLILLNATQDSNPHMAKLHKAKRRDSSLKKHPLPVDPSISEDDLAGCAMTTLIADWYCLRHAGSNAYQHITPANLALYRALCETFKEQNNSWPQKLDPSHYFFLNFIKLFEGALQRADHPVC